jgi:hypothetical protein
MIKQRRVGYVGHTIHIWRREKYIYRILVGKHEEERPALSLDDKVKINLKVVPLEGVEYTHVASLKTKGGLPGWLINY